MGGHSSAPPPPDYTPMIKEMELMREQQAQAAQDAALAQRKAMIDAQNNAAELGMRQANTAAGQDLMRMNEYQKALDAASSAKSRQEAAGMGAGISGAPYDIATATQARYANLGAAAPMLPSARANIIGDYQTNPVTSKLATANKFQSPDVSGLTFGGN